MIDREGETILRFDDTNPEAEKLEFIDNIMEDVKWLGWKPCKINFASDNFDRLYEYAIQLIKMGKAYVDHQVGEERRLERRRRRRSSVRVRSRRSAIVKAAARVGAWNRIDE